MKVTPAKINKPKTPKTRTYTAVKRSKKKSLYRKARENMDRKQQRMMKSRTMRKRRSRKR